MKNNCHTAGKTASEKGPIRGTRGTSRNAERSARGWTVSKRRFCKTPGKQTFLQDFAGGAKKQTVQPLRGTFRVPRIVAAGVVPSCHRDASRKCHSRPGGHSPRPPRPPSYPQATKARHVMPDHPTPPPPENCATPESAAETIGRWAWDKACDTSINTTFVEDGQTFIDGPLSDLSVLVQIPAVARLVRVSSRSAMALGPDHLPDDDWETVGSWRDALEATR